MCWAYCPACGTYTPYYDGYGRCFCERKGFRNVCTLCYKREFHGNGRECIVS